MSKYYLVRKIERAYAAQRKNIYQRLRPRAEVKTILFILGCQRSGTTLLARIFDKDLSSRCYPEFSKLSSQDRRDGRRGIRLNPLDSLVEEFRRLRTSFIVLKPLVESQNAPRLLDYFEGSRAIWVYRDYRDVAVSNLRHFNRRNGINDLRPIVRNEPGNWRAEKVSEALRAAVAGFFSEDMDPYDAAALFWYVRNRLFFDCGLDHRPEVLMCKYDELVARPRRVVRGLYRRLGLPYPGDEITRQVRPPTPNRKPAPRFSPGVAALAEGLMSRLDAAYARKGPLPVV
ncbi:MAG: sulfotransferase family protein [Chloroflexota bacterium]